MTQKLPFVDIGFHVYVEDGGEPIGAVRDVAPDGKPELLIYVENAGPFRVPLEAVREVQEEKVVLDLAKLSDELREAIPRAHAAEQPGL